MRAYRTVQPFKLSLSSTVLLNECDQRAVIIVVPVVAGLFIICSTVCIITCCCLTTCAYFRYTTTRQCYKKAKTPNEKYHLFQCAFKNASKEDKEAFLGLAIREMYGEHNPFPIEQVQNEEQASEAVEEVDYQSEPANNHTAITMSPQLAQSNGHFPPNADSDKDNSKRQTSSNKRKRREECRSKSIECARMMQSKYKLPNQGS